MKRLTAHRAVRRLLELAQDHLHREHAGPGPRRMAKRLESESIGLMRLALAVAIKAEDLALKATVRDAMRARNRYGNGHVRVVRREVP